MFERFTDRARRVVVEAQEEARLLRHNRIGTEHLLLGLLREGQGVAARALAELDIGLDAARERVREIEGEGSPQVPAGGHIPFTPRAKRVLELALREALALGHNYIGTEHILLGVIAEGDGVAVRVLAELGADGHRVRRQVTGLAREPVSIAVPLSGPPGRGAHAQMAGLQTRLEAVEARASVLTAEVDRLRKLLKRHGIDTDDEGGEASSGSEPGSGADSDSGSDSGSAAG